MNTTRTFPFLALAGLTLLAVGCGESTVSLPSGVQYVDLVAGKGDAAKSGDFLEVHYVGSLQADGTKFDNSRENAEPYVFCLGVGQVFPGWDTGLVGMKPGGKRKLLLPAAMAGGKEGHGLLLPPNADVQFEVELLRIVPGFSIQELKAGEGPAARWHDTVVLRYTGWLKQSGKQFISTALDKPHTFEIGYRDPKTGSALIRGLEGGVAGMKQGEKRKLVIPAELAHGKEGQQPDIPPDADLIYEVELVEIVKKEDITETPRPQ